MAARFASACGLDWHATLALWASEVGAGIAAGRIRYRADIVDGLENAPGAFIGILEGRNFGKLIIRVAA